MGYQEPKSVVIYQTNNGTASTSTPTITPPENKSGSLTPTSLVNLDSAVQETKMIRRTEERKYYKNGTLAEEKHTEEIELTVDEETRSQEKREDAKTTIERIKLFRKTVSDAIKVVFKLIQEKIEGR